LAALGREACGEARKGLQRRWADALECPDDFESRRPAVWVAYSAGGTLRSCERPRDRDDARSADGESCQTNPVPIAVDVRQGLVVLEQRAAVQADEPVVVGDHAERAGVAEEEPNHIALAAPGSQTAHDDVGS